MADHKTPPAALIACLRDRARSGDERAAAARALGKTCRPDALAPLLEALDYFDDDIELDLYDYFDIRWAAAEALGVLGDRGATLKLIAVMRDSDEDEVARSAIWSLGQLRERRAIGPLIAVMQSQDPGNRWEAAMNALIVFNDPEIDKQIDAVQRWRRDQLPPSIEVEFAAELRAQRVWEKPPRS